MQLPKKKQIDPVMIEEKYSNNIYNVRNFMGTLHDSDYVLVKIKLRYEWPKCYNRTNNARTIERLKDGFSKHNDLIGEPTYFDLDDVTKFTNGIIYDMSFVNHQLVDQGDGLVENVRSA